MIEFAVNEQAHKMELDIGTSISLISKEQYNQLRDVPTLEKLSLILQTYTGENL